MTSEPTEAFLWTLLPGEDEPVVTGRIELAGGIASFNYGRSYVGRSQAIPLYLPELPLRTGAIEPLRGLTMAGCIKDAGPDAWGQRVIMQHLLGAAQGRVPGRVRAAHLSAALRIRPHRCA